MQPKLQEIESRYGMDIKSIVQMLYRKHDSLIGIANELGVTRPTLYSWIGRYQLQMLKAQAGLYNLTRS